jgi:dimethylargininase
MFTQAICRKPGPDAGQGLADPVLLLDQHAAQMAVLERLGLAVRVLDALPGHPDAYRIEDVALVFPELAVLTHPGARPRRGEEWALEPLLAASRPLARIQPPGTLDGGDVLVAGRIVLVGRSVRTNGYGATQLENLLAPHGYAVVPVPVGSGPRFKTSVSGLGEDRLLVAPAFAERPELAGFRRLVVDPAEAGAVNALWINGTLLVPAGFPRTRALLGTLGLPVLELEWSEVRKTGGGLSSLSLRF